MTLERIVDMFGSSIGRHLVSRRVEINKEGPIKGIKTYRIELWDVNSHQIIETEEVTAHMPAEKKPDIVKILEMGIVQKMFNHAFK